MRLPRNNSRLLCAQQVGQCIWEKKYVSLCKLSNDQSERENLPQGSNDKFLFDSNSPQEGNYPIYFSGSQGDKSNSSNDSNGL